MVTQLKTQGSKQVSNSSPKLIQQPLMGSEQQPAQESLELLLQRAQLNTGSISPSDSSRIQRTIGNQAYSRLHNNTPTANQLPSAGASLQAILDRTAVLSNKSTIQKKENHTGLPDSLKSGVETLSGQSMDDVEVHYNSSKSAELQALAYTQGTDIHIGPGQEKHLPHEAWHVVQQKQGRVKPMVELQGVGINDDSTLEREADVMGVKAMQRTSLPQSEGDSRKPYAFPSSLLTSKPTSKPVQRRVIEDNGQLVQNRNVAVAWKGGGTYADTPAVINGKTIPPSANKEGMILEPDLKEVDKIWRLLAADQHVGWRIEAPSVGPWQLPNPVGLEELDAFARAGNFNPPQRTEAENATLFTLIVRGSPDDAQLLHAIIVHEQHHVEEQKEVIDEVLRPWDAEVEANGAQANDPLNALMAYKALRIAPAQKIADEIVEKMRAKGIAFHDTDEGKEPDIESVNADMITHQYTVRLRPHPAN